MAKTLKNVEIHEWRPSLQKIGKTFLFFLIIDFLFYFVIVVISIFFDYKLSETLPWIGVPGTIIIFMVVFALLLPECIEGMYGVYERVEKGEIGECRVAELLSMFPDDWYIFNDVILESAQIDHILICPKGVYTIETKNYSGEIYGDSKEFEWTQIIGDKLIAFYNPVKQANKHSFILGKNIRNQGFGIYVNSLVIFTSDSVDIKVVSPDVPVFHVSDLKKFFEDKEDKIPSNKCAEISNYIQNLISHSESVNEYLKK